MLRSCFLLLAFLVVFAPRHGRAESFTYQGRISDSGAPVVQASDFVFRLFDAEVGGTQVGPDLPLDAVTVTEGVFTCQLDFGAGTFDGSPRWLEIEARTPADPSDTQPFTALAPRQPVTPAPYALRALEAAPGWELTSGVLTNNNSGFVGINRDFAIGPAEEFGVHSPTTNLYGGMYVSTQGPTARPFYGYHDIASGATAWTYLDAATNSWTLYNSGERLTVTVTGDVGIGTMSPTQRLDVAGSIRASTGFVFPDGSVQTSAATTFGGNTLDQAYDEGGPGAGSIIEVSTGSPVQLTGSADVSLTGDGLFLLGKADGQNIAVDTNEISARNNGVASRLNFNVTGGDVVIGTSSSNVGIGTSSPAHRLHVAGELHISGASDDISVPHGNTLRFSQQDANSSDPMLDMKEVLGGAFVVGYGENGKGNFYMTAEQNDGNHGWIDVSDENGDPQAGIYVSSSGSGVVWGDTKNFRIPNPRDPATDIVYASLEGPEAAAYVRGSGELVNGRAQVALPAHFTDVAALEGMTVQITPRSEMSKGLAVVSRSLESFEVRELMQGAGTYEFDWEVKAVRAAHRDYRVIRPAAKSLRARPEFVEAEGGDR